MIKFIFSSGSKTLFEVLLLISILGWISIFWVTYRFLKKNYCIIWTWIDPLIKTFYVFLLANACHVAWVLVLVINTSNYPVTKSRMAFEVFRQWAVWVLAATMQIYYHKVGNYAVRLQRHKIGSDRFMAMSNSSRDAIIEIDDKSIIGYANAAAAVIFGYPDEIDMTGMLITDLMPEKYRAMHLQGMNVFLTTGKGRLLNEHLPVELEGLRKDGSAVPIELTVSCYQVNDQSRFMAVIRNITHRKELEQRAP